MAISTGIANQPNGESYIVFDEDTRRHLEEDGVDYMYFIFPVEKLTDIPGQFKTLINEKGNKHVFMTDTIEELCCTVWHRSGRLRGNTGSLQRIL